MDETDATKKSTIVVYIVATTGSRLTTSSFAKAMKDRSVFRQVERKRVLILDALYQTFSGDTTNVRMLTQPASVLDSAKAIARLVGQRG